MRKITFWAISLCCFVALGTGLAAIRGYSHSNLPTPAHQERKTHSVDVRLLKQLDSPLQLLETRTVDKFTGEVSLTVRNNAKTAVTAYTIHSAKECGGTLSHHFLLSNIHSKDKILRPLKDSQLPFITDPCDHGPLVTTLSIDFIEFIDGKTWGKDRNNSRDRLAGLRAGARDETAVIKSQIEERGARAFIEPSTEAEELDSYKLTNRTDQYIRGYKEGRQIRRSQIERAFKEGGEKKGREKLRTPFDASGKEGI